MRVLRYCHNVLFYQDIPKSGTTQLPKPERRYGHHRSNITTAGRDVNDDDDSAHSWYKMMYKKLHQIDKEHGIVVIIIYIIICCRSINSSISTS